MNACKEFDTLLSLHAAGALDAAEEARVAAHLERCAACRAEADADREALSLAKLPPVSDAERRAVAEAPYRALVALRHADRRRAGWKRASVAIAVAAAALLAVLVPAVLRRAPEVPGAPAPTASTAVTTAQWEGPDLDTLWNDTEVLELEGTSGSSSQETDAALAALEL